MLLFIFTARYSFFAASEHPRPRTMRLTPLNMKLMPRIIPIIEAPVKKLRHIMTASTMLKIPEISIHSEPLMGRSRTYSAIFAMPSSTK